MNQRTAQQIRTGPAAAPAPSPIYHRVMISLMVAAGLAIVVSVIAYGWDYYLLDLAQRPFSPKHADLKPSGTTGLRLGMLGFALFALVYLYPLRKHWNWLAKKGKTRHWLDYHIALGLTAPAIITLHSSFKFQGFAGMAYWSMLALTSSGIIGRYFYAQIPKSLGAAEMSFKELEESRSQLNGQLHAQNIVPVEEVERLFRLPAIERVQAMPLSVALLWMVALDVARPLKIWKVRRRASTAGSRLLTLGGMLRTRNADLEQAVRVVRKQASLSKKILFLSKTQQVFHLWHVIHRPFSYTFAILVSIHVIVVTLLGYF